MDVNIYSSKSPVLGRHGGVSSDQPLASAIGIDILQKGGNAADAAIAMAAAVSVAMPTMCGLGGDCNCIYYDAATKLTSSLNGSGHSAKDLTFQKVKDAGIKPEDTSVEGPCHGIFVTVPGTVAGLFNCLRLYGSGKLSMSELLAPAVKLAESGAPLPPKTATVWKNKIRVLEKSPNHSDFFVNGRIPEPGDVYCSSKLAQCFKLLASDGQEAFYQGPIADKIIKAVRNAGGLLTAEDMLHHLQISSSATSSLPPSLEISGYRLWEMAPNTIGIVALVALNLLKGFDLKALGHNSTEYIHLVAESLYVAYMDCWPYLCDPELASNSYEHLLTEKYAEDRRRNIDPKKHTKVQGISNEVVGGSDTSYVTAVDPEGNACSFILSVSSAFGSGIIPDDCGFVLHDRGKCFSFDETSRNCFGPRKRSLHTIIPAMVTDESTGDVVASMGVVGRWMQPQGHVQVLLNMVVFGMDPQTALDKPRFGVGNSSEYASFIDTTESLLYVEAEIPEAVRSALRAKGHIVVQSGDPMGRGHVIAKQKLWSSSPSSDVWWAGSDRRCDGIALGL